LEKKGNKDTMKRVLIVSDDAVSSKMAGPAIRDWEYARALSRHCRVTLAVPNQSDLAPYDFELRRYDSTALVAGDSEQALQAMAEDKDVMVTSGYVLKRFPFLKELPIPLVLSIPHSFVLENIQHFISAGESQEVQWRVFADGAAVLNAQLAAGDFFVCNSERQRDFWLGMLAAVGRVNPATYADDPALRRLVDVVPFGLPDEPPQHHRQALKGVYKGIAPDAKVLFWGGGLYDWLDPLTPIRAMPQVLKERSDVVLFFAATRHPSPNVVDVSPMCHRAMRLSDELGLTDHHIFFHDWIPYQERENYLLEADLGLSLHLDHVETRFAFRNRILDYIWAGLPIIATEGDTASDLVQRHRLGAVVGYEDVAGVAQAVLSLLAVSDLKATLAPRFADLAQVYCWEQTTRPLVEFCRAPRLAPDRGVLVAPVTLALTMPTMTVPDRGEAALPARSWGERLVKAWHSLRQGGLGALRREIVGYLRWKLER
jgi:glycosyltransferase involved in cell wall biosynthesis